jgi:hypothetical protein
MPEIAVFTPVRRESEQALRAMLRDLRRGRRAAGAVPEAASVGMRESPFLELAGGTHFARLVVIDTGGKRCRRPHLLFTSRFDGDAGDYCAAVAATAEARRIWEQCERPEQRPLTAAALSNYLLNDRSDHTPASYVVSAFPASATVDHINAALELRAKLARFTVEAARMDAVTLAQAFRESDVLREIAGG